jgi:hypothetical protein
MNCSHFKPHDSMTQFLMTTAAAVVNTHVIVANR